MNILSKCLGLALPAMLGLLMAAATPSYARVNHNLAVVLDPETHTLQGRDVIRVEPPVAQVMRFYLAPQTRITAVTSGGAFIPYKFSDGHLEIKAAAPEAADETMVVEIEYSAVFDDPAPENPLNTDNPGYGVSGVIDTRGVLLLAGAGWYPASENDGGGMQLLVDAPPGFLAVTSGDLVGHTNQGGRTLSRWKVPAPVSGISLTAGPFTRRTRPAGNGVLAATYFTSALDHLATDYLKASAEYLKLYQDLFGPYAFNQFAVVENFFPTGYGFAGYTLMGRSVLQLPFIIHTSLGHEIAHCWWGNGVLVDYSGGNWSEGLTTYVADYLYKERESAEAARQYRLQWLRNYANLVGPQDDFALSRFISRNDPVSKTIGYDKSAMVFHMLRRTVGDAVFWQTLQEIYGAHRFEKISWEDLRRAFEKNANRSLATFFDQWINRPGAPELSLEMVRAHSATSGSAVSGRILQKQPYYSLDVPLQLKTDARTATQSVLLEQAHTRFEISAQGLPRRLDADPQVDLFRRLAPQEIPATINAIKGAETVTIAVSEDLDRAWLDIARGLKISLGLPHARIVSGVQDIPADAAAVIRIGLGSDGPPPELGSTAESAPLQVAVGHFSYDGRVYDRGESASFFGVYQKNGRPTALFLPGSDSKAAQSAVLKVTHYGKYSYLIFEGTQNRVKGVWPVTVSPLMYVWPPRNGDK